VKTKAEETRVVKAEEGREKTRKRKETRREGTEKEIK